MTGGVLGLDLAIGATGIAYPNGDLTTIVPAAKYRNYHRHRVIWQHLAARLAEHQPDLVILEDYNLGAGRRTPIALVRAAELAGGLRSLLTSSDLAWAAIPPASLKRYATGRGNADKDAMVEAATLDAFKTNRQAPTDDHQADAYWLRELGIDALTLGHHRHLIPPARHGQAIAPLDVDRITTARHHP